MFVRLEALAPVVTRRLDLAADCGVLVLASTVCANPTDHVTRVEATLSAVAVALTVRLLGGVLLREYEAWRGQGLGPILTLTSVLALTITGAIALLRVAVPAYAAAMTLREFLSVALPGMLLLRASIPDLVDVRPPLPRRRAHPRDRAPRAPHRPAAPG